MFVGLGADADEAVSVAYDFSRSRQDARMGFNAG